MRTLVQLSDVAYVFNGKTPSRIEQKETGHPVLKIKDISSHGRFTGNFDSYVDTELAAKFSEKHVALDDTLILNAAHNADYVGSKSYLAEPAVAGSLPTGEWLVVRAKKGCADAHYLHHWITSSLVKKRLRDLVKGIHLYPKDVATLDLQLPPLLEQQRIAAIFDKADNVRRKRQEAIRLADEFLRAVFIDMFGNPVSNTKQLQYQSISELCHVATGATPSREQADYFGGVYPWIKTGEVDSAWITSAEEYITDKAIKETNCKPFPKQTILVAMYGQGKTRGKVGMLGIAAATNQACAAILPSEAIDPFFLYAQLTLMYDHLRSMGRGGNQENLNLGMIKSLQILVPPRPLIEKFLTIQRRTQSVIDKARIAEDEAKRLANSLNATFLA